MTSKPISRNTPVTIGLLVTLVGFILTGVGGFRHLENRLVTLETKLELHVESPNYHQNLSQDLHENYMRRDEIQARFNHIEELLKELKQDMKTLLNRTK